MKKAAGILAMTVFVVLIGLAWTVAADSAKKADGKTHIYVLTDISSLRGGSGEPDDTESLIRLLFYTDRLHIDGIGATYSSHGGGLVKPELIDTVLTAYSEVYPSLRGHGKFQNPSSISAHIHAGTLAIGSKNIGEGHDTPLSTDIERVVLGARKPLWILVWGGSADLAQALWSISGKGQEKYLENLRVYAISDQYDDCGQWIREHYPQLKYVVNNAAFRGMYHGGDESLVSEEWVKENVKSHMNALARLYPVYDGGDPWGPVKGLKEGDSPSFLYLLSGDPEDPSDEHWGGSFHNIPGTGQWTDGGREDYDCAIATVYKWRADFQASFAERLGWGDR